jgi:SAM-dependent methyltransferase
VLDVAYGRGAVLFPAAERVGAAGHVEGIDLSEGMVQATSAEAERRGVTVRLRVMDAEHLELPDADFDRVLCGFGVMLLPDQLTGLGEMRRVLRREGRLGVSTWQAAEADDLAVVLRSLGLEQPRPLGWITEPDVLPALLIRAGFRDVHVSLDAHVFHHADPDAYWRGARGSGMRRNIDTLDAEQTARVRATLAKRLMPSQRDDGYHVAATALLATAIR